MFDQQGRRPSSYGEMTIWDAIDDLYEQIEDLEPSGDGDEPGGLPDAEDTTGEGYGPGG